MHRVRYFLLYAVLAPVVAVAGPQVAPPPRPVLSSAEVEKMLARGKKFAEQGKLDLFVAATAEWKLKAEDGRLWEPAVDLGRKLIDRAEMTGDRKPQGTASSFKDFATYLHKNKPIFTRLDTPYTRPDPGELDPPALYLPEAIQAPGVECATGLICTLILSRGSVRTGKGIQSSVVFANGDVSAVTGLYSVIIVCDGDVTLTGSHASGSLIVARGNITVRRGATRCVLMAGGKVTLRNQEARSTTGNRATVIVEGKPNTLGITFFELSTVGVEVKGADGAVRVASVAEQKPFAAAGVKVGDVITGVNGKKPDSAESLRRLLRDALAVGDATVTLKRGDKTETVKVSLPE